MGKTNENITFKGEPTTVTGTVVEEGKPLPQFKLTANDLSDVDNSTYAGKVLVLSVIPSIDTPVCHLQTKRFNEEAAGLSDDVVVLTVSEDLPFAQKRWCGAEGAEAIQTASDYKYKSFGQTFGTDLEKLGLLARAVFVADKEGVVKHVEYVDEVTNEPDYESALSAAKSLV